MTYDELDAQDVRVSRARTLKVKIITTAHSLETFELMKDIQGSMEITFHPVNMEDRKISCPILPSVMREAMEELEIEYAALKTEFREL